MRAPLIKSSILFQLVHFHIFFDVTDHSFVLIASGLSSAALVAVTSSRLLKSGFSVFIGFRVPSFAACPYRLGLAAHSHGRNLFNSAFSFVVWFKVSCGTTIYCYMLSPGVESPLSSNSVYCPGFLTPRVRSLMMLDLSTASLSSRTSCS